MEGPIRSFVMLWPVSLWFGTRRTPRTVPSPWGFDPRDPDAAGPLVRELEREGFDVILSIGELRENAIGSNCGQFVTRLDEERELVSRSALAGDAYTVPAAMAGKGNL